MSLTVVVLLKYAAMILLIVSGIYFLARGLGVTLGEIKYKGSLVRDVPAGIVLVALAIGIAKFWTLTDEEETITKIINADGSSSTTTHKTFETRSYESKTP